MSTYKSDVNLGERYRDEQTGFEGVATSVTFFQHACERVEVEAYDAERVRVVTSCFDAPRLTSVRTGKAAVASRPGGPGLPVPQRGSMSR